MLWVRQIIGGGAGFVLELTRAARDLGCRI